MSVEGEKTCPLCAEEMDLTDQQLKPCKCGYEICVWCWHHIMDMAEKDETEGRCPACRTLYNKEKIVGMAAKCERLVAEMSMERKVKSQKAKSKTSEGRKQLSSVRVIQRNLVYIVGLPLDLADEDLLQCKEYFGQYGKVLKVSISRTAAGAVQHFANNTCSVYITYSKEDEAIRCIQSVHGFVLEGRSLRACFGTTKYCHSWLRNVPCSNLDCLYLHEIGSQEDSFTKDEIISAYTRVQQIIGATNDMQRRSGNMLPPPADECCNNGSTSSGKPISRIVTNNQASIFGGSPPNSSNGRSIALPAAVSWGMRCQPPSASLAYSKGPIKQKPDACGSLAFSTAVTSPPQVSVLHGDIGKKAYEESRTSQQKSKLEPLEYVKQYTGADYRRTMLETPVTPGLPVTSTMSSQFVTPTSEDKYKSVNMPPNVQNICSDMSSMSIDRHQGLQRCDAEQFREPMVLVAAGKAATSINDISVAREQPDLRSDLQSPVAEVAFQEVEEDLFSFVDQRLKDPEILTNKSYLPNSNQSFHILNDSRCYSPQQANRPLNGNVDPPVVNKKLNTGLLSYACSVPVISNGYPEKVVSSCDLDSTIEHSHFLPNEGKRKHVGRFEDEVAKVNCDSTVDMGESRIISNILSMDFDSWDESLTSPQNLVKLLGETDKRKGSLRVSSSWKVQNSNQSRFSFAREEECINQVSDVEPSFGNIGQALKNSPFNHDFVKNRDFYLEKMGNCNGFSSVGVEEADNFANGHSLISISRAQMSAPPGFSVPCRAPPPGFSSHERMDQTFDTLSGNHSLNTSSLLRKPYQAPPAVNMGSTVDIEFMDPAILAVGRGRFPGGLSNPATDMRSNFPLQFSTFENEARLQLMLRSVPPHQNQRYTEIGDSFPTHADAYGIP